MDALPEVQTEALGKIRVPLWYRYGLPDVCPLALYELICLSLDRAGPSPHKDGDREQLRDL